MITLRIASDTKPADAAGAIAGQLRDEGSVLLQAVGAAAVNQTVKSLALAESYLKPEGQCVASRVRRVQVTIGGKPKTALQWLAWKERMPLCDECVKYERKAGSDVQRFGDGD